MEVKLENVLICGVREFQVKGRDGKQDRTFYFVDWYCGGSANSSMIEKEYIPDYKKLIAKFVSMEVRIEQREKGVSYRILQVLNKAS